MLAQNNRKECTRLPPFWSQPHIRGRDNATKQTQVKATQTGTITIKISTSGLWRYSNRMDGELQHTT